MTINRNVFVDSRAFLRTPCASFAHTFCKNLLTLLCGLTNRHFVCRLSGEKVNATWNT